MTKTKDELIESWWPEGSGHSAYSSGACDGASKMYDHRQKEIDALRKFADAVMTYLDCVKRKWEHDMSAEEDFLKDLYKLLPAARVMEVK